MKYLGREVTYRHKNKRLSIFFPNGTIFLGTSFALKRFKKKDIKEIFILLFYPYERINNRFLKG